ncbi:MAG: transglycosylase SLT domain-containing protein [Acidobacteria bacterium]|nr:transglycosylase SLT domain-containing protein [Acidobacteriota bacterium]
MKESFSAVFLLLTMLTNFACAQKTDVKPTVETKTYSQMDDDEKSRFIAAKSDEILALFGRTEGDGINAEGLRLIRTQIDSYSKRFSLPKLDRCDSKSWLKNDLTSILMRGVKTAAAINEEFSAQNLPPQIGLYTAMIETEFCPCLQAPTGPLGMFQFLASSAKDLGLKTKAKASPTNPDERCQPKLAARAAAKFYRMMIDRDFKSDAIGLPLAVSTYNRGQGNTKRHISEVAAISKAPRISFWTLIETTELLRETFGKGGSHLNRRSISNSLNRKTSNTCRNFLRRQSLAKIRKPSESMRVL